MVKDVFYRKAGIFCSIAWIILFVIRIIGQRNFVSIGNLLLGVLALNLLENPLLALGLLFFRQVEKNKRQSALIRIPVLLFIIISFISFIFWLLQTFVLYRD